MKRLLILALFLQGCAMQPVPVVKTVRVEVPVAVRVAPPEALLACGQAAPGFQFYAPAPGSPDVVIRAEDQAEFRAWVNEKVRCIRAWQEWAK